MHAPPLSEAFSNWGLLQVEINVQKTIQIDDEIVHGLPMDDSPVASSSDIKKSKGTIP